MTRCSLLRAVVCAGGLSVMAMPAGWAQEQFSLAQCLAGKSAASEKAGCLKQQRAAEQRQRERQAADWKRQRKAEEDAAKRQAEDAGREADRARQAAQAASRRREAEARQEGERAPQAEADARREAEREARQAAERARRLHDEQGRAADQLRPRGCAGPVPTRDCAMSGDPIADRIRETQRDAAGRHQAR